MLNKKKSVLICDNSDTKDILRGIFQEKDFKIEFLQNTEDAIEKLRFIPCDMVIVDEGFDRENRVLDFINTMMMPLRRNIFVVLLSDSLKTDNGLKAFSKSVNAIVNKKEIRDILDILDRAISENDKFYMVYKETLSKIGKK